MDFIVGLPRMSKHHDAIWVVVGRLRQPTFLALKISFITEQLADLYIKKVVRLHRIPSTIVLDRDTKFASKF